MNELPRAERPMKKPCNKREDGGIRRCERPTGHKGPHRSDDVEWGGKAHGGRIMGTGDQDYRTGVLHGILAERVHRKLVTVGFFECEGGCGRRWHSLSEALAELDPAHVERRSRARKPTAKDNIEKSADDPFNVKGKCRFCHDAEES